MTMNERTGHRSLTYSRFHRPRQLAPHLEPVFAHIAEHHARRRQALIAATGCAMIDIDGLEYCPRCYEPLALIETQRSAGPPKRARATQALGERALVPVFSVSYIADEHDDVTALRTSRLFPPAGMRDVHQTCAEYAAFVLGIHQTHRCIP
jgi:hypothetical protein